MGSGVQRKSVKKATRQVPKVELSSGNVFADLKVPAAGEALAKAELAGLVCAILSERKLTKARAAVVLGIDQLEVSDLLHGKFDEFSTDRLFRFLNTLGQEVEIVVRPRQENGRAWTRVVGG